MSDRLVAAVGIEIYLHHREPFAKLLNAGVGNNIAPAPAGEGN